MSRRVDESELRQAFEAGAESMRERAAALVDLVREREWTPEECAAAVRALPLPLDDGARDDAQGQEVNER